MFSKKIEDPDELRPKKISQNDETLVVKKV
jgi:hypothetical protein